MHAHRIAFAASLIAACSSAPQEARRPAGIAGAAGAPLAIAALSASALEPSGVGTAKIDGVLSAGEWDSAGSVEFAANVPASAGGGTVPARFYAMNDGVNLYFAVRFEAPFRGGASLVVELDSNGDGVISAGDDAVVASGDPWGWQLFADDFRIACGEALCAPQDTEPFGGVPAGTNDGAGAVRTSGGVSVAEIAHPLASGDLLHDVQLAPGATVGLRVFLRNLDTCGEWPACFGDTDLPLGGSIAMRIATPPSGSPPPTAEPPPPPVVEPPTPPQPVDEPPPPPLMPVAVRIEVKPPHPESPAPIDLRARGTVPVAILGAPSFDAGTVDVASVLFAGAPVAIRGNGTAMASLEDVNGDSVVDLVLHFESSALQLAPGATTAELTGVAGAVPFAGATPIRIVP